MAYVQQSELKGLIPDAYLTDAMDDDASGLADTGVWAGISDAVDTDINGRLKDKVALVAAKASALLKAAATSLALYYAYKRRGVSNDANPWTNDAQRWQDRLDAIGKGDEAVETQGADAASADIVTEPARTYPSSGEMLT